MPTSAPPPTQQPSSSPSSATIRALQPLKPDLHERAWASVPHPTLPLLATAHAKAVTVFSLSTLSSHSTLTGGHSRSVRSAAWKPGLPPHKLCLVTGSFDSTAGLWRWDGENEGGGGDVLEREITSSSVRAGGAGGDDDDGGGGGGDKEWEFTLVLEGHDSEVKSCVFSPSGAYLATCSRDKSVWIWEDIGATEADDEWETVAVLNEHEGDVKAVAWCPDLPSRNASARGVGGGGVYAPDVLASASYDNTVRVWREDGDAEWVCVAVLEGHGGTVWGVQWEPRERPGGGFPRLMSWSADGTIRIWTLREDEAGEGDGEAAAGGTGHRGGGLGGIPNTMRRSLKEDWACTAVLPQLHTGDVYSAAWSAENGLIASTGSDGTLALYGEDNTPPPPPLVPNDDDDGDHTMTNGGDAASAWRVLHQRPNAHGAYEVNHVTWSRRFDAGSAARGEEVMLVTTGDDGVVRPWEVAIDAGDAAAS